MERVGEMPPMLYCAHDSTVELDLVVLHTDVDDQLLSESLDSSARLHLADLAGAGP